MIYLTIAIRYIFFRQIIRYVLVSLRYLFQKKKKSLTVNPKNQVGHDPIEIADRQFHREFVKNADMRIYLSIGRSTDVQVPFFLLP